MPFSTKLIADYVEMTNAVLDAARFDSGQQLDQLIQALKHVLNPLQPADVSEQFSGLVQALCQFLEEPELFVADPADYGAFKSLVCGRIDEKIKALSELSEADIKRLIKESDERRTQAAKNLAKMAACTPPKPGTEAHTVSVEEYLRQTYGSQERARVLSTVIEARRIRGLIERRGELLMDLEQRANQRTETARRFNDAARELNRSSGEIILEHTFNGLRLAWAALTNGSMSLARAALENTGRALKYTSAASVLNSDIALAAASQRFFTSATEGERLDAQQPSLSRPLSLGSMGLAY